jgi:hypothetical protein
VVPCLPLDPRLAGYNSAGDDRLLKGDTIRSMPSLRGEVTSHVVRFCGMLKIPTSMKEIIHRQNSTFSFEMILLLCY